MNIRNYHGFGSFRQRRLDAAHAGLLRAAYGIRFPAKVTNADLYRRAKIRPPSAILRNLRLRLAEHVIRAEDYCPEPLPLLSILAFLRILLLPFQGSRCCGQGRALSFPQVLFDDALAPDQRGTAKFLRDLPSDTSFRRIGV